MAARPSALIVADSAQFRESLSTLLRSIPAIEAIEQVNDGPAVLTISPGLEPTVVLLDYGPSPNGGSRTLGRIKAKRPRARFVVMVNSEMQAQRAQSAGADVVLMKGVLAARLFETIQGLLESNVVLEGEVQ